MKKDKTLKGANQFTLSMTIYYDLILPPILDLINFICSIMGFNLYTMKK